MPDLPDAKVHAHPHAQRTKKHRGSTKIGYRDFAYAELAVTTNFTFLRGASHPDEYVHQAAQWGYHAGGAFVAGLSDGSHVLWSPLHVAYDRQAAGVEG
jgi:hypothetical protein